MNIRYFSSAWNDIKNSPAWFGKLALLALVALIPVFGWMVVAGYMYGWARSIAWGVHAPMPERIFGEGDDKPYARGFYALVITFVVSLIPLAVQALSNLFYYGASSSAIWGMSLFGITFDLIAMALSIAASVFASICCVRMAIYGRISAGFQFSRIFKMIKHDTDGALRLTGLSLVADLIAVAIIIGLTIVFSIFALMVFGTAFLAWAASGAALTSGNVAAFIANSGVLVVVFVIVCLAFLYLTIIAAIFAELLIVRATGYWVYQFEVPQWGKQDDPMPFEQTA